jgi:hypothetical protein
MCMEDIRIGRKVNSAAGVRNIPITTAVTLLGVNAKRVSLTVASDGVSIIRIGIGGIVASATLGFPLTVANPIHTFRIEDIGPELQGNITVFGGAAAVELAFIEGSLQDQ